MQVSKTPLSVMAFQLSTRMVVWQTLQTEQIHFSFPTAFIFAPLLAQGPATDFTHKDQFIYGDENY